MSSVVDNYAVGSELSDLGVGEEVGDPDGVNGEVFRFVRRFKLPLDCNVDALALEGKYFSVVEDGVGFAGLWGACAAEEADGVSVGVGGFVGGVDVDMEEGVVGPVVLADVGVGEVDAVVFSNFGDPAVGIEGDDEGGDEFAYEVFVV